MYMGTALPVSLARLTGDVGHLYWAVDQLIRFENYLVVEEEGDSLYHHGYNDEDGHISCCKWGRGEP